MRFGILRFIEGRIRPTDGSANHVALRVASGIAAPYPIIFPAALPGTQQAFTIDSSGNVGWQVLAGGGGTVTTFSATPASIFSVATPSTTPALSLASQSANLFLASPNGSAGTPAFRGLAIADISSLIGTTAGTIAAGNDSRFHNQNTDTGTSQTSFQIDSGNSGARLKNASGAIQVRNSGDTANADLAAGSLTLSGNLTVQGSVTEVQSNQVTVGDNTITLNNDVVTGTPTENAGIEVRRGGQPTVTIVQWDETVDEVFVTIGSTLRRVGVTLEQTFSNTDLVSNIFTWTHNLGRQYFPVTVVDNTNESVGCRVVFTSATQAQIDLTGFGAITGTWRVVGG